MSGPADQPARWLSSSRIRFERRVRGWTEEDLAFQLRGCAGWLSDSDAGIDAAMVASWERGECPSSYHLALLSLALDLPVSDLQSWPSGERRSRPFVGVHIEAQRRERGMRREVLARLVGRPVRWVRRVERDLLDLRVSELCGLADALRVTPGQLLDGALIETSRREVAEVDRRSFLRYMAVLGGAGAMDLELLNLALSRVIRPDRRLIEDLARVTWSLAEDWEAIGPEVLSPAAQNHVKALSFLLMEVPAALDQELLRVVCDAAALAGFLAFKLDDRGRARGYLDMTEMMGTDAGDGNRVALALLLKAKLRSPAHGGGQASLARTMLEAAVTAADRGSNQLLAWLHYEQALLKALLGDEHALELMDRSDAAFAARRVGTSRLLGAHDDATQAGRRAQCLLTLGRAAEAAAILEQFVVTGDPTRANDRTADRRDLGAAYAIQGQPDRACAELSTALTLASATGLRQKIESIAAVRQRLLERYRHMSQVSALDEQLHQLL